MTKNTSHRFLPGVRLADLVSKLKRNFKWINLHNLDNYPLHNSDFLAFAASGAYLGIRSSITLIKSLFSAHPLQALSSPQSDKIFFSSLTFSFFRLTFVKSMDFSGKQKQFI